MRQTKFYDLVLDKFSIGEIYGVSFDGEDLGRVEMHTKHTCNPPQNYWRAFGYAEHLTQRPHPKTWGNGYRHGWGDIGGEYPTAEYAAEALFKNRVKMTTVNRHE